MQGNSPWNRPYHPDEGRGRGFQSDRKRPREVDYNIATPELHRGPDFGGYDSAHRSRPNWYGNSQGRRDIHDRLGNDERGGFNPRFGDTSPPPHIGHGYPPRGSMPPFHDDYSRIAPRIDESTNFGRHRPGPPDHFRYPHEGIHSMPELGREYPRDRLREPPRDDYRMQGPREGAGFRPRQATPTSSPYAHPSPRDVYPSPREIGGHVGGGIWDPSRPSHHRDHGPTHPSVNRSFCPPDRDRDNELAWDRNRDREFKDRVSRDREVDARDSNFRNRDHYPDDNSRFPGRTGMTPRDREAPIQRSLSHESIPVLRYDGDHHGTMSGRRRSLSPVPQIPVSSSESFIREPWHENSVNFSRVPSSDVGEPRPRFESHGHRPLFQGHREPRFGFGRPAEPSLGHRIPPTRFGLEFELRKRSLGMGVPGRGRFLGMGTSIRQETFGRGLSSWSRFGTSIGGLSRAGDDPSRVFARNPADFDLRRKHEFQPLDGQPRLAHGDPSSGIHHGQFIRRFGARPGRGPRFGPTDGARPMMAFQRGIRDQGEQSGGLPSLIVPQTADVEMEEGEETGREYGDDQVSDDPVAPNGNQEVQENEDRPCEAEQMPPRVMTDKNVIEMEEQSQLYLQYRVLFDLCRLGINGSHLITVVPTANQIRPLDVPVIEIENGSPRPNLIDAVPAANPKVQPVDLSSSPRPYSANSPRVGAHVGNSSSAPVGLLESAVTPQLQRYPSGATTPVLTSNNRNAHSFHGSPRP